MIAIFISAQIREQESLQFVLKMNSPGLLRIVHIGGACFKYQQ